MVSVNIHDCKTEKLLASFNNISPTISIEDLKKEMQRVQKKFTMCRQSYRKEPKGKTLSDDVMISSLLAEGKKTLKIYFKDLGPQVGWTTVFLTEYAGPPIIYFLIWWLRQPNNASWSPLTPMRFDSNIKWMALLCWVGHYVKRLLETIFVHRFSHATMPITNIFRNSIYYWGFAAFVSYFINHPYYTAAKYGIVQIYFGLAVFIFAELGNLSCHLLLRSLRPPGSKVRRIPQPSNNPFTWLFALVACPNYTYEVLAWCGFGIMTQSLPAIIFMLAGFYQMTIWAKGKLRNYRSEFSDFPRRRKAILPYIL